MKASTIRGKTHVNKDLEVIKSTKSQESELRQNASHKKYKF
jgi:hypothetical protein